jgi:hypothetical protein
MRELKFALAAVPSALRASVMLAGLLGSPVNLNTSETGTVTITPLGGPFSAIVGPGPEFAFCVGPNANNCVDSGLSGSVDISNNQVAFTFFGGTFAATGAFVIQLSGFDVTISNVTFNSGSLSSGSFGLTSFTATSMTFTGTVNASAFGAAGGRTITFNVTTGAPLNPTPLPSSIIFVITGLGAAALYGAAKALRSPRLTVE